jgi:hypothetical protein
MRLLTRLPRSGESAESFWERASLGPRLKETDSFSAALNKLIILDKKVKAHSGKRRLCNLKPEIYEVFAITRLNQLFDIKYTKRKPWRGSKTGQANLVVFHFSPAAREVQSGLFFWSCRRFAGPRIRGRESNWGLGHPCGTALIALDSRPHCIPYQLQQRHDHAPPSEIRAA